MKNAGFLLAMIFWVILMHGASFGSQSDPGSGQASSQNRQGATAETEAKGNENGQVAREKDAAGSSLDRNQTSPIVRAGSLVKPRTPARPPKSVSPHQIRSAKTAANGNLSAANKPADTLESRQSGSGTSTGILHKTATPHSVAVRLTADSVNGQQFKNSRNPGARMATSGGSPNSTHGTAVINGSDIKRKP
jgi:hypothetical protein